VAGADRQTGSQMLYERQHNIHPDVAAPSIIVDGIHSPENMGAVLHLAKTAGSQSVLFIEQEKFDACSPQNIRRAAHGAEKTIHWNSCGRDQFFAQPQQSETRIAVELTDTSVSVFERPCQSVALSLLAMNGRVSLRPCWPVVSNRCAFPCMVQTV